MKTYKKSQNSILLFRMRATTLVAALAVLALSTLEAHADIVVDLVGDKDGFGVGCPIQSWLHYLDYGAYWADNRGPGDPAFTDYWYANDKSWTHSYSLGGMIPTSATLEIFLAGIANYADWSADVRVNGVTVGTIPGLGEVGYTHDLTRLYCFNVPVNLIDGSNPIPIVVDVSSSGDGYIIDYSEMTIVPEPATLFLLGFGGLALLRKRRA